MAAEVIAHGGAAVTVYDAMPSAGPQVSDGGTWRTQSHAQRAAAGISRALWRGEAASRASDRSVSAGSAARLERGAGPADIRRLQRAGVSASVQGVAVAARMAAAARCGGRAIRAAPSLDRMGREWRSCIRNARRQARRRCRATVLALGGASWPRLGSDGAWAETLASKGIAIAPLRPANCGFTVAWSEYSAIASRASR